MSISLCCQFIEEKVSKKGKVSFDNLFEEKVLQYNRFLDKKYSTPEIILVWKHNLSKIEEMLPRIHLLGIKSFRLSSNIFPLGEELPSVLESNEEINLQLKRIGKFILDQEIRISCHPSQFVVLSSKSPDVIAKGIKNLRHHAWILDQLGLPSNHSCPINIHGGVRGELSTLIKTTKELPDNVRGRLTFENDEKCYNVEELHQVWQQTSVPITFDWHHHSFNTGNLSAEKASALAISTWGDYKPVMHLSNSEPEFMDKGSFTEKRKHSFYTHYVPDELKNLINSDQVDCDWEFKGKNLAIFKAVEEFNLKI